MATAIPADVDEARRRVREMIGETDPTSSWEPHDIDLLLVGALSLELTDVSESGSSRKLSQLQAASLKMWETYQAIADEAGGAAPAGTGTRVRPIIRE